MENRRSIIFSWSGVLLVVDQATKWWAAQVNAQPVIHYTVNQGISFGILAQLPSWLLSMLLAGILGGLYLVLQAVWHKYPLAAAVFFAGGVSNLVDRVIWGSVQDWLLIPGTSLYNNLADWYIAGALLWILLHEIWPQPKVAQK